MPGRVLSLSISALRSLRGFDEWLHLGGRWRRRRPDAEIEELRVMLADREKKCPEALNLPISVPAPLDPPLIALVFRRQRKLPVQHVFAVVRFEQHRAKATGDFGIKNHSAP